MPLNRRIVKRNLSFVGETGGERLAAGVVEWRRIVGAYCCKLALLMIEVGNDL